jgi:pre-rRNA-processing protein RIX1
MVSVASELATLRALTFRISSTATSQLPQHVTAIAALLANCRSLFSSPHTTASKASSEASVAIHKYLTLLSALLLDRTIQGRWSSIVLIKATIEIGGWEILQQKALRWVQGLLGILKKPDPPSSKKLCLITLTRIFVLTREYPTLVREVTTPNLPAFIQSSLQLASSTPPASLLQTVLESFNQLLPWHHTTFRSYLRQIHPLLAQTIAPTPSSKLASERTSGTAFRVTVDVSAAARNLYTQLPRSAPKGASSEEWQSSVQKTIINAHRVADKIFRAVIEEWKPLSRNLQVVNGHTLEDDVQDLEMDPMVLPAWSGIFAGGERLVSLLRLVTDHIDCATAASVNLNVGAVIGLITRLLSLTVPSSSGSKDFQNNVRFNNQISKEERENLWVTLPDLHVAAIEMLIALTRRCEISTSAIDMTMLDQLVYLFVSEKEIPQVRTACYLSVAELLKRSGVALPKSSIDPLGLIIRSCCDDILPSERSSSSLKQPAQQAKTNGNNQQAVVNADTFLSSTKSLQNPAAVFKGLQEAAYALLAVLLTNIRPQCMSDSMRARLDRTAVLVGHKPAMVASVLNQPPSRKFGKPTASILPLLAHIYPNEQDVEALLRPRMPVIRIGAQSLEGGEGEEEAHNVEGDEEDDDNEFTGHELDTLLETAANTDSGEGDVTMMEAVNGEAAETTVPFSDSGDRGNEGKTVTKDAERSETSSKRPQDGQVSHVPPKRVKVSNELETPFTPVPPMPMSTTVMVSTTSIVSEAGNPVSPVPVTLEKSSSLSLAPFVEQPNEESDDEDIVPLVLGQDTDEESE